MNITTLCFGNINRSPAALYILQRAAEELNVDLTVDSAGTSNYNEGKHANKTMRDKLAEYGFDMEAHRAKQITQDIINTSDVILCMDPGNAKKLLKMFPDMNTNKIVMIANFIDGIDKVPDPHFATKEVKEQVFTECYKSISTGCYNLIQDLADGKTINPDNTNGGMFGW